MQVGGKNVLTTVPRMGSLRCFRDGEFTLMRMSEHAPLCRMNNDTSKKSEICCMSKKNWEFHGPNGEVGRVT